MSASHVVQMSSGTASAVAGKRVVERYGPDDTVLLFADVLMEDDDNYRFLAEATEWIGAPLVTLTDGRTPFDVFVDVKMLGNSRADPCSRILKREPLKAWMHEHAPDGVMHIGFDLLEGDRIETNRASLAAVDIEVDYPLLWDPPMFKWECVDMVRDAGIKPPDLTVDGYEHANCSGGCIKAGIGQFVKLHRERPDAFALWRDGEERVRETVGDYAILRDRRGGDTKPLTLTQLEDRIDAEHHRAPELLDLLAADNPNRSCNCMGDDWA